MITNQVRLPKGQRARGWDTWASDLVNPNFASFAKSCGGLGIQVSENEQLDHAMKKLFDHRGPALLEVKADVKLI